METPARVDALVRLLDDDDGQVAAAAMAELLSLEDGLPDQIVNELQETSNPLLRRRLHQIASILKIRRRRRMLGEKLSADGCDILRGLAELHLQWYDNDAEDWIEADWAELMDEAKAYRPKTTRRLSQFMSDLGFKVSPAGELETDYYCLGIVIEDRTGADFILCALALLTGVGFGWRGNVVRVEGQFALLDCHDHLLFPSDWRVEMRAHRRYEVWTRGMLLRHATLMLFLCASATVSVSYVYSLGRCIAGASDPDWNSSLPYPYDGKVKSKPVA